MSEVAELEAVCERAWPPRERLEIDGAVLRFTHGFTRRANSARVEAGGGDLEGLVARAEREYRSRGLRPGFRLTPLTPDGFEPLLRERGYYVDTEAVVMVAHELPEGTTPGAGDGIELLPAFGEEWLRVFQAIERQWPPEQDPGARWVLGSGVAPRRFALARVGGAPAATGYARLEDDWLYIASVATFPERRRLGLARAISGRLFDWGARSGARRAILQAETKNTAAQALYASLGFEPRYRYRDFVPGRAAAAD